MNITIYGAGYVGLTMAACFADHGIYVTCIDKDAERINKLLNGTIPIYEPDLNKYVEHQTKITERLKFASSVEKIENIVFVAVGSPPEKDGSADLSAIYDVINDIAKKATSNTTVVVKSTVPVGTCKKLSFTLNHINPYIKFEVCSNPEFLREGSAVYDFINPDRTVIGCHEESSKNALTLLYKQMLIQPIFVSQETAELSKYASNAFLATKLSFINEIANLCEKTGANIKDVSRIMGMDKRIGSAFLQASCGYGGSCFPKDMLALNKMADGYGVDLKICKSVIESNKERTELMFTKIVNACNGVIGKRIAVLGLTFKANTDDVRESVAISVIKLLQKAGADIVAYDPQGITNASKELNEVSFCYEKNAVIKGSDALVIMTEWQEFVDMDMKKAKKLMKGDVLVDLRNIYDPTKMRELGFFYTSIGRS